MESNSQQYNKIVKQDNTEMLAISLLDVDTIIAKYMEEKIIPQLEQNGQQIKVPLLYANAERWKSTKRDGYLKDREGKIQIPLVMFKRNSIAKNDSLKFLKEEAVTYPTVKKFSKQNAYDRFSVLNSNFAKLYQTYDVRMPEYVNLVYEVVIWTNYTEHSNKILEAFNYASERYWGEKDKYKFRVQIENFENTQDLGAGTERIIKTTFTMTVFAYILPKRLESIPTTQKGSTLRKVIVTNEATFTDEELQKLRR
jgi:hypothetical protein